MNKAQRKLMEIKKRPLTKEELKDLKITWDLLKTELKKAIDVFNKREIYKRELKKAIKKYGIANLPDEVVKTIPNDLSVLNERIWYLHIKIWYYIVMIAWKNAENEIIRRVLNA